MNKSTPLNKSLKEKAKSISNKEEKTFIFGKDIKVRVYLEKEALKHKDHELLLTEILGPIPLGYPVEDKDIPDFYMRCLTCEGENRKNGYKTIAYYNLDGTQRI